MQKIVKAADIVVMRSSACPSSDCESESITSSVVKFKVSQSAGVRKLLEVPPRELITEDVGNITTQVVQVSQTVVSNCEMGS
jgi:hypothetical protein